MIDEADRMVEKGHFAELQNLLEMLNTSQFNPSRQTFVFSATLTLEHCLPARMQQKKRKSSERNRLQILMEKVGVKDKPKVIDLTRKQATVETLTETRISCSKDEKDLLLYYFLLQYPGPQHGVCQQHRLHQASERAAADPGLCSSDAAR